MTASELLRRYRTRELSPREATQAALEQIDALNPVVNAFCLVDADRALAQEDESEPRLSRGEPRGSLDGVPVSIKDLLLTDGWTTMRVSVLTSAGQEWSEDAPSVARL